ncbi:hypothetical protein EYF80_061423 [Liparis tanakae]|uniref:Uncharacterized protein n=1 Tax=Liparis tanakae TaxID=230148 RepID=A0A4Z2EI61_9TELE|nr:hypothetical protein EYF80_061423 [Liparis tanakae]
MSKYEGLWDTFPGCSPGPRAWTRVDHRVAAALVVVGDHAGLGTQTQGPQRGAGLHEEARRELHLLRVSLRVLHVDQDLSQAGLHRLHQELCRLQDHVPPGLQA